MEKCVIQLHAVVYTFIVLLVSDNSMLFLYPCTLLDGCGPVCLENNVCLVLPSPSSPTSIPGKCTARVLPARAYELFLQNCASALSCRKCTLYQRLIWPICAYVCVHIYQSLSHKRHTQRTKVKRLEIKTRVPDTPLAARHI